MQTIDAFPHILPRVGLYDLDVRFGVMDRFPDYRQVLTLATPPIEQVATGASARDLAQLANDSLAAICSKYPDPLHRLRRRVAHGRP
jgi:hypothetical protein